MQHRKQLGVTEIKFEFVKQFFCTHTYVKQPNHRQIHKDNNKVLWVCSECKKQIERLRWNPPKNSR